MFSPSFPYLSLKYTKYSYFRINTRAKSCKRNKYTLHIIFDTAYRKRLRNIFFLLNTFSVLCLAIRHIYIDWGILFDQFVFLCCNFCLHWRFHITPLLTYKFICGLKRYLAINLNLSVLKL